MTEGVHRHDARAVIGDSRVHHNLISGVTDERCLDEVKVASSIISATGRDGSSTCGGE
jgi:hypothetical protein